MKIALCILCILCFTQEIPFKPQDEFAINLDFQFKTRYVSNNVIEMNKSEQVSTTGGVLPYLYLNVNVLKLNEGEVRIRVEDNRGQVCYNRKAEAGMVAKLDLGFTDDIKDRVSAHEFVVRFIGKDKSVLSRITIAFEKDGTYLVNGEKRGRI